MAKKSEYETQAKLDRLTKAMGLEKKGTKSSVKAKKKNGPSFSTLEVVILLLITALVSLFMGSAATYKLVDINKGEKVDSELQDFINNYEYIIDNYNGSVDKEKLLDAALEGMLRTLDNNSNYLEADNANNFNIYLEGSYKGLGIEVYNDENKNIIVYRVIAGGPADKAGLKANDIITKLNGEEVKGVATTDFVKKVQKVSNKDIELTYIRDNNENTVKLNMQKVTIKSVASQMFEDSGKKIGYLTVDIFANNTYKQFETELKKLEKEKIDSLIIDLRGNSGGYLSSAEKMISNFLDSKHVIYQIEQNNKKTKYYSKGTKTKDYKITILVDESSASASEVMASALKEQYGATLVGKKTFGKGTVQELNDLTNGDKYKLTTKNWLTSKGTWVDGKGIEPDIQVDFDSNKYSENPALENDTQFQRALEEAKK